MRFFYSSFLVFLYFPSSRTKQPPNSRLHAALAARARSAGPSRPRARGSSRGSRRTGKVPRPLRGRRCGSRSIAGHDPVMEDCGKADMRGFAAGALSLPHPREPPPGLRTRTRLSCRLPRPKFGFELRPGEEMRQTLKPRAIGEIGEFSRHLRDIGGGALRALDNLGNFNGVRIFLRAESWLSRPAKASGLFIWSSHLFRKCYAYVLIIRPFCEDNKIRKVEFYFSTAHLSLFRNRAGPSPKRMSLARSFRYGEAQELSA